MKSQTPSQAPCPNNVSMPRDGQGRKANGPHEKVDPVVRSNGNMNAAETSRTSMFVFALWAIVS